MAEPSIKQDPDAHGTSPATFVDDDIYEDAGDLEFKNDPKYQRLYLARVPKYIWENWSKLDDDAEIPLGTIRQSTEVGADGVPRDKLMMLLRSDLSQHQHVPKEYELQVTSETVLNTFVFTEQDLPGYKSKSNMKFDPATANMPARLNRSKAEKPREGSLFDKSKGFQPYYRRAIPKKTTLVGRVAHEVNCVAVVNAESDRILTERTLEAMKPKSGTIFIQGDASSMERAFIQPGTVRAAGAFGGFIKNTTVPTKGKLAQETKTARMPQNELLDLIFGCFRQYNFWSMKALRAKLRQPEAYLKETLEKIADMPRSGSFALHWTLKPEYKQTTDEGTDPDVGAAPMVSGGIDGTEDSDMGDIDGDDDEDDENVKMEDVLPH